jgi:SAM-dependent methyltransferase
MNVRSTRVNLSINLQMQRELDSDTPGILACPLCGGRLRRGDGGLICPADGVRFPRHPSGLLDLRAPEGRAAADAFAARYRADRLADGWQPLSAEVARVLPDGDPPGFTRLYWTVRRESWAVLVGLLNDVGQIGKLSHKPMAGARPLKIADLGAGFPWLSHRFAALGHAIVAIDLSPDADFGLGAARLFPTAGQWDDPAGSFWQPGAFLPVLGDLAQPPLAAGACDVVICNASLHYAGDLRAALARIARALRPGGALVIMDSPIVAAPLPDRDGGRVLARAAVADALRGAGLAATWQPVPRGWLWRRHQLKNRLLRRPVFEFPIIIGRRGPAS